MGRQLLALTHFLVDINEILEIRAPETEVSRLDHCLILEGVPDPLRQDDARTGLITVLMGVRSGQTEIVGMAADSNNYVRSLLDIPYQLDVLSIIGIGYKDQVRKPFDESHLQWEKIHIGKFSLPEENKEAEE